MAIIKTDGGYNALPISYKRGNPIPLDTTAVWYSKTELEKYAQSGVTAYVGQILSLVDETDNTVKVYKIVDTDGKLELVGAQADWIAESGISAILNKPNVKQSNDITSVQMKSTKAGGKGYKIGLIYNDEGNYGYQLIFNKYEDDTKNEEEAQAAVKTLQEFIRYPNYYSVIGSNAIYHAGNMSWVGGPYWLADNSGTEHWTVKVQVGGEDTLISGFNNNSDNESEFKRYNYFIIDGHPEIGNVEVGWNSFSVGQDSYAQNVNSFAAGKNTKAVGKQSAAFGESTIAGHGALVGGLRSQALGSNSAAFGTDTVVKGSNSFAAGNHLIVNNNYTTVFGRANRVDNDDDNPAIFTIGNGNDKNNRSNAFVVYNDGTAEVGTEAELEDSLKVATVGQLKGVSDLIVQSDWSITDSNKYDFIKNKPQIFPSAGTNSLIAGSDCKASGKNTIAIGQSCTVSANNSIAVGQGLVVSKSYAEAAFGRYNKDKDYLLFSIGNGTNSYSNNRSNAFEVYTTGAVWFSELDEIRNFTQGYVRDKVQEYAIFPGAGEGSGADFLSNILPISFLDSFCIYDQRQNIPTPKIKRIEIWGQGSDDNLYHSIGQIKYSIPTDKNGIYFLLEAFVSDKSNTFRIGEYIEDSYLEANVASMNLSLGSVSMDDTDILYDYWKPIKNQGNAIILEKTQIDISRLGDAFIKMQGDESPYSYFSIYPSIINSSVDSDQIFALVENSDGKLVLSIHKDHFDEYKEKDIEEFRFATLYSYILPLRNTGYFPEGTDIQPLLEYNHIQIRLYSDPEGGEENEIVEDVTEGNEERLLWCKVAIEHQIDYSP